jgi:hypothetical protein
MAARATDIRVAPAPPMFGQFGLFNYSAIYIVIFKHNDTNIYSGVSGLSPASSTKVFFRT